MTENKLKCGIKKIKIYFYIIVYIALLFSSCKQEENIETAEKQLTPEAQLAEIQHRIDSLESFVSTAPILKPATVAPNFGLFQTLQSVGLDLKQSLKIINTLADTVELGTLRAGQVFWVGFDQKDTSKAILFRYAENFATLHFLIMDSAGEWKYKIVEKPVNVRYSMYEGVLHEGSNLYNTLRDIGIPQVMVGVVAGVLECKVSFRTDARVGDRFKILLKETRFQDSIWIGGKVLYAGYDGSKVKRSEAFLYEEADPKSSFNAHYTEDGEALIHSGLRYPLDRLHITSGFGYRIHPITGQRAFHSGVDYRGSVGTPVYAVAEGVVAQSSYDDHSGNFVAIKHSDNSQSWYLHLSQRGVGSGARVRSRQVIGKVGNTGRSNGPHLHFAIKQPNGQWMNPLLKKMIATPKLEGAKLAALTVQVKNIREILSKTEAAESMDIGDTLQATVKWVEAL
ncbi:MAG: M23 family metallopeptidase [Fibromonadales bacterium]|nr:M23 family metallopeptidase [Fibromonadales bacterium]